MLYKLNFRVKITISLPKNFRILRLKGKNDQENKQTEKKTTNKQHQNKPNSFFRKVFY